MPSLKASIKAKQASLSAVTSAPTISALRESISALEARKVEMEAKLKLLKEGEQTPISKSEREAVEMERKKWELVRERRKRCWREVEGSLIEQGLKREELWVSFVEAVECGSH